jgi:hypothetical protein
MALALLVLLAQLPPLLHAAEGQPRPAAAAGAAGAVSAGLHRYPHLYKDPAQPIAARVDDLLAKMTTEEKVAQLLELWGGAGVFEKLLYVYNRTSVGAVMIGGGAPNATCRNDPVCRIAVQNELQRKLVEGSRLGIPVTFTQETMTSGSHNGTSFPHPVSQGSSWNMTLVHEIGKAVGSEAYYSGVDRGYSPVLQVCTDPRFGRWHEVQRRSCRTICLCLHSSALPCGSAAALTEARWLQNFGGDGKLVAACATAAVTGLQVRHATAPNQHCVRRARRVQD